MKTFHLFQGVQLSALGRDRDLQQRFGRLRLCHPTACVIVRHKWDVVRHKWVILRNKCVTRYVIVPHTITFNAVSTVTIVRARIWRTRSDDDIAEQLPTGIGSGSGDRDSNTRLWEVVQVLSDLWQRSRPSRSLWWSGLHKLSGFLQEIRSGEILML